jgi:hypothetical protein
MRTFMKFLAVAAVVGLWAGAATAALNLANTTPRQIVVETEGAKGSCSSVLNSLAYPGYMPSHPNSRLAGTECQCYGALPLSAACVATAGPSYTNQSDDYFAVLIPVATPDPRLATPQVVVWQVQVPTPVWTAALTRTMAQSGAALTNLDLTQTVVFDQFTSQVAPGNLANAQCTANLTPDACCTGPAAGTCSALYFQARGLRSGIPIRLTSVPTAGDYPFYGNADNDNVLTAAGDVPAPNNGCMGPGFPDATCCTGVGAGTGAGWCATSVPDVGAPLYLSCAAAGALPIATPVSTGAVTAAATGTLTTGTTITTNQTGMPAGMATCTGASSNTLPCAGHTLVITSAHAQQNVDHDIAAVPGATLGVIQLGEAITFAGGETFIIRDFNVAAPATTGTVYGPPYPGAAVPATNADPCSTLAAGGGFQTLAGSGDTVLTAMAYAPIDVQPGGGIEFGGAVPAFAPLDWRLDEAVDSDGDQMPDRLDNCMLHPQSQATPTTSPVPISVRADTDWDGYGNGCDGDFDQSGASVGGADFNPIFLTDFGAGTDSGVGTDMDGGGSVGGEDFNPYFLGLFGPGWNGLSGYTCAGPDPLAACVAPGNPYPCCTGAGTGIPGDNPVTQFCACP